MAIRFGPTPFANGVTRSPLEVGITLPEDIPVVGGARIDISTGRPRPGSVGGTGRDASGQAFAPAGRGADCIFPWKTDPLTGNCRLFAGDQPGPEPGGMGGGQAVAGGFNMPAFVPDVVGNISRRDGSSGPILRCPRGTVLATDNLCYAKGTRGLAAHRKWKPGPRPFLSGADRKCLLRANTLRKSKSSRKILRELGMG